MISDKSHTREWIMDIRSRYLGRDPILIEKMIRALTLVEALRSAGLEFVFKGGTSLALILGEVHRFSIDIDIILQEDQPLENIFGDVLNLSAFHRYEENQRTALIPKQHYKFFFDSAVEDKESYILLDILYQLKAYPVIKEVDISSPLLFEEGRIVQVACPDIECLLADKLTAFAPHTTGILLGKGKELEIAKQLFDVGLLFDLAEDMDLVSETYSMIVTRELEYRDLNALLHDDVLFDTLNTALDIGMRGYPPNDDFTEISMGIRKLAAFIISGNYSFDTAVVNASKAAYLAALILKDERAITRFQNEIDLTHLVITNPKFNKLNKVKKTSPEAYFYFYRALQLLNWNLP